MASKLLIGGLYFKKLFNNNITYEKFAEFKFSNN